MSLKMYSIFDRTAKAYNKPYYAVNDGMAVRMFSEAVNDPKSSLGQNPEDYALYQIGHFCEDTGIISQSDIGPERLMFATEVIDPDRLAGDSDIVKISKRLDALVDFIESLGDLRGDL